LSDSVALLHVIHQLDKEHATLDGLKEEDLTKRAFVMIQNANNMGVPEVVRPQDIVSSNVKLNTVYVSFIFNTRHGLEELTAEEYEKCKLMLDDIEGTKEER
jgi:plastin-1